MQAPGDARHVVNDHYDTDGFGALLAVLQPDVAFRYEELLLSAAATGDFGCWTTWRGFAIDRIVKHLGAKQADELAYATSYDKSPGESFVGYVGIVI